ncbi:spermidine synthase [Desulfoplanes sp.]
MIPWKLLHTASVPGSDTPLHLYRRGQEYSIRVGAEELMNSRVHGSETALAELTCAKIRSIAAPAILIGGLGMGFTVAAALAHLDAKAIVTVAELIPEVVEWNRTVLAAFAGRPLFDKRVQVKTADVAEIMRNNPGKYDAILLDVDNGPEAMTHRENSKLYTMQGLKRARTALRPGGILSVWSAGPSLAFTKRLTKTGFLVEQTQAYARGAHGGSKHSIWLARRER